MVKQKKYWALREVLRFYKKHIGYYIGFLLILIVKAVISFFSAMLVAQIISNIMELKYTLVWRYVTINLLILTANHALSYLNTYFYKNLENKVRFDLQQRIIESSLNINMSYYDNLGSGVIVTRLTSDIDHISERFKTLTEKIVNVLRRFSYMLYIFFLDFYIGLFVLGSVIIVSLVYTVRIHYLSKLKPAVKAQREVVNSKIIETIRAVKDIKTLNCDGNVLSLVGDAQNEFFRRDNHEYYVGNGLCKLTDCVTSLSDFIFIALSIFLILNRGLTTVVFYTCYLYKDHTFTLASEVGDFRYKLAECEVCAERLFALVYPKEEDKDKYGELNPEVFNGDITFKDVKFSYTTRRQILKGISFKIKPKTTIALVGESGCGKSTIANLIGHLYYKQSGQILFGNTEIEQLDKQFIRDNIAIINQFPYLFNLSIRENFKMVSSNITDDEIWKLCEKVNLKKFIEGLPKKLDSVIGEGGCQLSGGQRQKLCIARALSRNVKVMIFDEATSSLDNASQEDIMQVIKSLTSQITIILIAHRLSTITYADSILLIKNGQLVAQGKHKKLLKENDYYQELYNKQ